MPLDTPKSIFIKEVMDIGEQLTLLGEHWRGLLEADTKVAFQDGLHRLHHSTEIMQVCVSGLMYRAGLTQRDTYEAQGHADPTDTEARASAKGDTRGGLIRALLKRRGLS